MKREAYLVKRDTRYDMRDTNILVWLPSPIGDAVLCTPALRAIRRRFKSAQISFFANAVVREILSPGSFNDVWLKQQIGNPFAIAKMLKAHKFAYAVLFKNSFASALAVFLAGIPSRIGYAREGRGFLLTDRLYPPKLSGIRFKPLSMIDYYLAIASWLGADTADKNLELLTGPQAANSLQAKLPELLNCEGPLIIIVPGAAGGPSKRWLPERFAQTADRLITRHNATVVVSVSSAPIEKQIAAEICNSSKLSLRGQRSNLKRRIINLAQSPVGLGELKSLFSSADLVITNDTGPRHIAVALGRKTISLLGPNDPAWTDIGYENEIRIIGDVPCAPCNRPVCKKAEHLCMQAITVEMVCSAAKRLFENNQIKSAPDVRQEFIEISKSLFIDADYEAGLSELGLTSIDSVFSFSAAKNLAKDNLAEYRTRLQFEISTPSTTLFLKRYDSPPMLVQLKNWLCHRSRKSCSAFDFEPADKLAAMGINTPKTISYGEQWSTLFEKRSFIITEKIPDAESLERKLPDYFNAPATAENLRFRRSFIAKLAAFVKKFHETNYRHRDLYFSHIFYSNGGQFYLVDLARVFKPLVFAERFRVKDIAQVHYSAPGRYFSKTDRLRFYLEYAGRGRLTAKDKTFIRKVINKAKRMARHDVKHGRPVPFAS